MKTFKLIIIATLTLLPGSHMLAQKMQVSVDEIINATTIYLEKMYPDSLFRIENILETFKVHNKKT